MNAVEDEERVCPDCNVTLKYTGTTIATIPMRFIHVCSNCKKEYKYRKIYDKSYFKIKK